MYPFTYVLWIYRHNERERETRKMYGQRGGGGGGEGGGGKETQTSTIISTRRLGRFLGPEEKEVPSDKVIESLRSDTGDRASNKTINQQRKERMVVIMFPFQSKGRQEGR